MTGYPLLWAFFLFSGGIFFTWLFGVSFPLLLSACGIFGALSLRKGIFLSIFLFLAGALYSHFRLPPSLPLDSVVKGVFCVRGNLASSESRGYYLDRYFNDGKLYLEGKLCDVPKKLKPYLWSRGYYYGLKVLRFNRLTVKRSLFYERLRELYPREVAGFLIGAITGDKRRIPRSLREKVYASGLGHLLAVSGLHVGLIAGALWLTFYSLLGFSPRIVFIVCAVFLACFIFAIGFQPSAVRAFTLFLFYGVGRILGLRADPLNLLGASGLLLELYNPFIALDAGFQLSFTAFFFIALSLKLGLSPLVVYSSPQLATLPLTAMHFGYLSLASFVSNFFAIPVFSIALPLAFLSFIPLIGEFLAPMVSFLIELIFFISLLFFKLLPPHNL